MNLKGYLIPDEVNHKHPRMSFNIRGISLLLLWLPAIFYVFMTLWGFLKVLLIFVFHFRKPFKAKDALWITFILPVEYSKKIVGIPLRIGPRSLICFSVSLLPKQHGNTHEHKNIPTSVYKFINAEYISCSATIWRTIYISEHTHTHTQAW